MAPHPLLRRAADNLRRLRFEALIAASTARLIGDEPAYASANIAELRRQMERTLGLALARLADDEVPDSLAQAAYEAGQLRAGQGIELSSVIHSFRIDLRVLWEELLIEGRRLGLAEDAGFSESLIEVWEVVEQNIADVIAGYHDAANRMTRRAEQLRAAAFDRLLRNSESDPSVLDEAAPILGFPKDGRYLCLVGSLAEPAPELIAHCGAALARHTLGSHFDWRAGEIVGVVALGPLAATQVIGRLDALQSSPVGAFEVSGLAAVPRGLRLARRARPAPDQPGIARLESRWPAAFAAADPELAGALSATVLRRLAALPEQRRAEISDAARAYLAGDGTVADVAARTFRHRNTARERLRDFEELTGLSLSRPADATIALLALLALAASDA